MRLDNWTSDYLLISYNYYNYWAANVTFNVSIYYVCFSSIYLLHLARHCMYLFHLLLAVVVYYVHELLLSFRSCAIYSYNYFFALNFTWLSVQYNYSLWNGCSRYIIIIVNVFDCTLTSVGVTMLISVLAREVVKRSLVNPCFRGRFYQGRISSSFPVLSAGECGIVTVSCKAVSLEIVSKPRPLIINSLPPVYGTPW